MDALMELRAALEAMPGIGQRTAMRLAMFLVRRPEGAARALEAALGRARAELSVCPQCGNVTEGGEGACRLCRDPNRDARMLCVVEDAEDIALLERSGGYRGRYFSLGGKISALRGTGPEQLRVAGMLEAARGVEEVLLALNCDVESDATAAYLRQRLAEETPGVKVTRLAFGIPAGSAIAYADPVTLERAIQGRTRL